MSGDRQRQGLERQGLERRGLERQGLERQGLERQGLERQGLERRLDDAERRGRELQAEASGLLADLDAASRIPLRADPARRLVEAHFDDTGLLAALTYTAEHSVDSYTLQGEILLSLAGGGLPARDAPDRMVAVVDAVLGDAPREAVAANERRTASVTAREGLVVRVAFDHRVLRGVRSQSLCDEVVPLAREAAVASDSVGRFRGADGTGRSGRNAR